MRIIFIIVLSIVFQFHCSSQEVVTIKAELGDTTSFEDIAMALNGGCSLACAIDWKLTASSSLESQNSNTYGIENLEDGDQSTAWVEGVSGYGIGEAITIIFAGKDSVDIPFYELGLNNGYCKNKRLWKANGRIKQALLKKNGEPRLILNFIDSMYSQSFNWDTSYLTVTNGDKVSIEILEVYKGEKYEDTAISDLYLMGAH